MSTGIHEVIDAIFKCQHGMQVRGSIPLYWNQEGVTHLKPDITLQHYDPLYTATRLHFEVTHLILLQLEIGLLSASCLCCKVL